MKIGLRELWLPVLAAGIGTAAGLVEKSASAPPGPAPAMAAGDLPTSTAASSADPVQRALAAVRTCRTLRDLAKLGPLLEALDKAQLAELLDGLERERALIKDDSVSSILAWWAKRDPESATEWVKPRLRVRQANWQFSFVEPMLESWIAAAPAAAWNALRAQAKFPGNYALLDAAIDAWPDQSSAALVRLIQELPKCANRSALLVRVASNMVRSASVDELRAKLPEAFAFLDEGERQDLMAGLPFLGGVREPMKFLELAAEMGMAADGAAWKNSLVAAAGEDGPGTAAWLEKMGDGFLRRYASDVVQEWRRKDVNASLDWAMQHGVLAVPPQRDGPQHELGSYDEYFRSLYPEFSSIDSRFSIWRDALSADSASALAWLGRQPAGPERDQLVELAANDEGWLRGNADPGKLLALILPAALELPEEGAGQVGYRLGRALGETDLASAAAWAKGLPDGTLKEQAELAVADTDPPTASAPETALRIEGKPGYVKSPHDTKGRAIDVRGLPQGTEVEDPYRPGKTLLIP